MKLIKYILVLMIATVSSVYAADASRLQAIRDDITSQGQALKTLTEKVYMLQKQAGGAATNGVELGAMERELQRINQVPIGSVQEINTLLEIAQVQGRVLNQLAEMVLRLQHRLGILPEGAPTAGAPQASGPQAL